MDKKKFFNVCVVVTVISILFLVSTHRKNPINPERIAYVGIGNALVKVDVADTAAEQEQGLGGRDGLKEDHAMLFAFDNNTKHFFWMKDMRFAIDMIWLDKDGKVIYIEKNLAPETYPALFGPKESSLYVLETVAGFADMYKVTVGVQTEFLPGPSSQ